jgi:hypothetical protein
MTAEPRTMVVNIQMQPRDSSLKMMLTCEAPPAAVLNSTAAIRTGRYSLFEMCALGYPKAWS